MADDAEDWKECKPGVPDHRCSLARTRSGIHHVQIGGVKVVTGKWPHGSLLLYNPTSYEHIAHNRDFSTGITVDIGSDVLSYTDLTLSDPVRKEELQICSPGPFKSSVAKAKPVKVKCGFPDCTTSGGLVDIANTTPGFVAVCSVESCLATSTNCAGRKLGQHQTREQFNTRAARSRNARLVTVRVNSGVRSTLRPALLCMPKAGVLAGKELLTDYGPDYWGLRSGKRKRDVSQSPGVAAPQEEEFRFPCGVCGKSFVKQSNMKRHSRTHNGGRPFTCDACKRSFSRKADLERHSRIHSGERPFTCDVCKKSFLRKANMKRHRTVCKAVLEPAYASSVSVPEQKS